MKCSSINCLKPPNPQSPNEAPQYSSKNEKSVDGNIKPSIYHFITIWPSGIKWINQLKTEYVNDRYAVLKLAVWIGIVG